MGDGPLCRAMSFGFCYTMDTGLLNATAMDIVWHQIQCHCWHCWHCIMSPSMSNDDTTHTMLSLVVGWHGVWMLPCMPLQSLPHPVSLLSCVSFVWQWHCWESVPDLSQSSPLLWIDPWDGHILLLLFLQLWCNGCGLPFPHNAVPLAKTWHSILLHQWVDCILQSWSWWVLNHVSLVACHNGHCSLHWHPNHLSFSLCVLMIGQTNGHCQSQGKSVEWVFPCTFMHVSVQCPMRLEPRWDCHGNGSLVSCPFSQFPFAKLASHSAICSSVVLRPIPFSWLISADVMSPLPVRSGQMKPCNFKLSLSPHPKQRSVKNLVELVPHCTLATFHNPLSTLVKLLHHAQAWYVQSA